VEEENMTEAPKRGRKPKAEEAPKAKPYFAAIEISCSADGLEKAAEMKFAELMDGKGGVMAVNEACGGSTYYQSLEEFPKVNRRCTCGQVGHFMVKYNIN